MKNIGISDETYTLLLAIKHEMETESNEVLSFDKVIKKLGEIENGKNNNIKKQDVSG